ncbi:bifunctional hydroxymethylpyrimidine kinase/phosphomethylpyrimidine kinase [Jiangella asiatica]|uniref:Bifunctional hydroxymethylpyrimidine kinase/phosphomethylpyrimidine kinase n=1 Tax=Jiangella asiatica TaxID=2530372 RepID=A0A4R5D7Y6_9ACTN|nr:bifunctional hydroxymethylpyrimidine kinase/phosphomethylpyrimidine kinase [Jiangella asiatica]TDE09649.1 bifunctional hydroxymethylpyrimidine kinase/phosphomethylpyrimidine kinase [Jiangella asiatica]
MATPTVITVAGSDPSGGAGIQADLKTFSALGAYGGAVLTALTAQNTHGVTGVLPVPGGFVADQLTALLDDLDVRAIKTGMLGGPDVVEAVADAVVRYAVPNVVVDPVMVATSGDRLVDDATVEAIRDRLLPLATVVTPNLPEAATLLGRPSVTAAEAADAAAELHAKGPATVVKGGHGDEPDAVDVLVDDDGTLELRVPRVRTANTHGTGCTFSSAIAVGLAHGRTLRESVSDAKAYLTAALRAADQLRVGGGHGPVHHFHAWWAPATTEVDA